MPDIESMKRTADMRERMSNQHRTGSPYDYKLAPAPSTGERINAIKEGERLRDQAKANGNPSLAKYYQDALDIGYEWLETLPESEKQYYRRK